MRVYTENSTGRLAQAEITHDEWESADLHGDIRFRFVRADGRGTPMACTADDFRSQFRPAHCDAFGTLLPPVC